MNKKRLAVLLPLAFAAAYGSALAQETPAAATTPADPAPADAPPPPAQAASETPSNTVIVSGFRSSLQKALNLKQQAVGVRDSIVAEDIGKFPEANIAESLQRVPGVILNRDESSAE